MTQKTKPWAVEPADDLWEPPPVDASAVPSPQIATDLYRRMVLIRRFEDRVNELFKAGRVPGTIHLSSGQEATVVGTCAALRESDIITLTHRGHGQALAKGVDPGRLMAEIMGRADGVFRGKGGSLHVGDVARGAMPALAIVGASSPIAAGLAFADVYRGGDGVVCNFHGDGSVNKGEWHEAMNLATVWRLPVLFVCENNFYASTTNLRRVLLNDQLSERADAYRMRSMTIDGNDVLAVYAAVTQTAVQARAGEGPTFIECLTYRQAGHKRNDEGRYRPAEEVSVWMARDPIDRLRSRLLDEGIVAAADLDALDEEAADIAAAAEAFALASPEPDPAVAFEDLHA